MDADKLLEGLLDKKLLAILRVFFKKKDQKLTLKEISKLSRINMTSTFRIVRKLVALEILGEEKIKYLKMYYIMENDKTKFLDGILEQKKSILDEFVDSVAKDEAVKAIMVEGTSEKDKANLLIIGENINSDAIKEAIVRIREKYNFTITHLVLDQAQYEHMTQMNLYTGVRQILFHR